MHYRVGHAVVRRSELVRMKLVRTRRGETSSAPVFGTWFGSLGRAAGVPWMEGMYLRGRSDFGGTWTVVLHLVGFFDITIEAVVRFEHLHNVQFSKPRSSDGSQLLLSFSRRRFLCRTSYHQFCTALQFSSKLSNPSSSSLNKTSNKSNYSRDLTLFKRDLIKPRPSPGPYGKPSAI